MKLRVALQGPHAPHAPRQAVGAQPPAQQAQAGHQGLGGIPAAQELRMPTFLVNAGQANEV